VCDSSQLEEDNSLWHLQEMFPQISNATVREGIFNGPDIKKNLQMAGMLKSYMELCF